MIRRDDPGLIFNKFPDRIVYDMRVAHIPQVLPNADHTLAVRCTPEHFTPVAKLLLLLLVKLYNFIAETAIYVSILILIINMSNDAHQVHPFNLSLRM
jgi:hypothetical protein